MNSVVAQDKHINLQAAGTMIYLNNAQLRFDFGALESVQYLTAEFERRDIGGFSTNRPVTTQEIRDFLYVFSANTRVRSEKTASTAGELPSLKLARYADRQGDPRQAPGRARPQRADRSQEVPDDRLLRGRSSSCASTSRRSQGDYSIPFAKAGRLVQDLVDLCHDQTSHFLGVTTTRVRDRIPAVPRGQLRAAIGVVFGSRAGPGQTPASRAGHGGAVLADRADRRSPTRCMHRPAGSATKSAS
jgi:hypothetical protein